MIAKTNITLIIAVMWLCCRPTWAQAPFTGGSSGGGAVTLSTSSCVAVPVSPFSGGAGSTAFQNKLVASNCAVTMPMAFAGGPEDGFSNKSLIVSVCNSSANTPFYGGAADGFANNSMIVSACPPSIITPYYGGLADGFANNSQVVSACQSVIISPYSGGIVDGFANNSLIVSACQTVIINPYTGGLADGFANNAQVVSACQAVIINPYGGGTHDGFANNTLTTSGCQPVIINPYGGGANDGFANNALIISGCQSVIINPYSGGEQDGFANNTGIVSTCQPVIINPYAGGVQDGFANNSLIISVCQPIVYNPYTGGIADGFANTLLNQYNVNPDTLPSSTYACVNGRVQIGVAPNAQVTNYQWELSTNGGTNFSAISNNTLYSGADSDTLLIDSAALGLHGYAYRVLVRYSGCGTGYSSPSTLVVGQQPGPPLVIKNPNVPVICPGTNASATFNAGSGGAGSIQDWYQYSTDAGLSWNAYTPAGNIQTGAIQGLNILRIRAWRTATGQGCVASVSDTASWTVAGRGFWIGVTSSDWNTASNWGCGIIPDTTTDVIIPAVQLGNNQPNIYNTPTAYARQLTIEPNASVTAYFGFNLELHGDLINSGISSFGIGTVRFGGASPQRIRGLNPSAFAYVEVANRNAGMALTLEQNITVSNQFRVMQGMVNLNGYDIDLGSTGNLSGETETSRITGSSGQVKSIINLNSMSTAYNNIHGLGIDLITGATANPGLTQVNRGHHIYTLSYGQPAIERYFEIIPAVNDQLDVTMRMHYFNAELNPAVHLENQFFPYRSVDGGLNWMEQNYPTLITRDPSANWVQQTNINAFSDWTLGNWGGGALPVELLEFTARAEGEVVRLKWVTAVEINNDYFVVERSSDGIHFTDLLVVDGAGNSTSTITYLETDFHPLPGTSYYRLRQTDFDGTFKHSQIVSVTFSGSAYPSFKAFLDGHQDFQVLYQGVDKDRLNITIYDVTGRMIISNEYQAGAGKNLFRIENPGLPAAVYLLELKSGDFYASEKLFVR